MLNWHIMSYACRLTPNKLGEGIGWVGVLLGSVTVLRSMTRVFGVVSPTDIQPWLFLICGFVVTGVGIGVTTYHRIQRALLDGQSLTTIYSANNVAIMAGRPVPFPQYLPPPPEIPSSIVSPKTGPV